MNVTEYTHLLNKPETVQEKQTEALEKIVQEFPYFQSARALYLKGLYNQNSFKYNYALKIAAAHTTDRSVLFDFITSDTFTTINKELFDKNEAELLNIQVDDSEIVDANQEIPARTDYAEEPQLEIRENTIEQSLLSSIKEAEIPTVELEVSKITIDDFVQAPEETQNKEPEPAEIADEIEDTVIKEAVSEPAPEATPEAISAEEKLDLGKPLEFSAGERHSFQEWLQLSKLKPIERENPPTTTQEPTPTSEAHFEKQKKNVLIDRFIEANPKIPPIKKDAEIPAVFYEPSFADSSSLMTETLARVYLEQKKYQKAIQAYEILILKYPEKSSFFADRILDIKNLQQNNK
ncbi:hypothetical protein G4D82_00675 [Flavobacterium sp. CYK-4]|uniref:tetratricopeptide repeat protein n=1 Tax=Flavobacterium lotistagni TaxID=2709660 RepID=UPI00140A8CDF|nr:tetratricopeptide repeat protein [Flavobacterium lotistagni]NHM05721.1 hypothetical protein [Flavobacterium lotistagni]